MKTAIIFLLDDYADWEGSYLSSTLNQNKDWNVKTASIQSEVSSIGGFKTKVDFLLTSLPSEIDLFVLIGGNSWEIENKELFSLIKSYLNSDVIVGAICGAVDYLSKNGLLTSFVHTGNSNYLWRDFANYTNELDYVEEQAIRDRNLITANGTAPIEFTELLLKAVEFDRDEVIEKMSYMNRFGFYKYSDKYGNPY